MCNNYILAPINLKLNFMNTKISPCIFQTLYSFPENYLDEKEAVDKILHLLFFPPISLTKQATQDVIVEI